MNDATTLVDFKVFDGINWSRIIQIKNIRAGMGEVISAFGLDQIYADTCYDLI